MISLNTFSRLLWGSRAFPDSRFYNTICYLLVLVRYNLIGYKLSDTWQQTYLSDSVVHCPQLDEKKLINKGRIEI